LAKKNEKIVGITPAMATGCSLNIMMEEMPERTFDVGIAEQHAVTFSTGLASQGLIPFCNVYSSFLQRAYDQIIHDAALQKLNVIFCLDRGGLVGADGATHHGAYDLAFMRSIPNMTVAAPMDEIELRNMMYTAQLGKHGTFSIRYPRGKGENVEWRKDFEELTPGVGRKISDGTDIAILTIGNTGNFAQKAISTLNDSDISVAHYDMRWAKPIDTDILHKVFQNFNKVITIEDGTLVGGFSSAVTEFMCDNQYTGVQLKRLGIPDRFVEHGTQQELYKECGFDVDSIAATIKSMVKKHVLSNVG
ncbi:MAG: 1-deoxy-D-xylulose-5-phosphate synthase, partial [Bacteroidales bacterium]|nr:1-deoxy-D-xylulose-5-phosphate synthase [Bacteroidales bacterium]